jgi:hypothetical protein
VFQHDDNDKQKEYKSIIIPDKVSMISAKGAKFCGDRECKVHYLDESVGQCSLYHSDVIPDQDSQLDTTFWKYKDELVEAVKRTLDEVNLRKQF